MTFGINQDECALPALVEHSFGQCHRFPAILRVSIPINSLVVLRVVLNGGWDLLGSPKPCRSFVDIKRVQMPLEETRFSSVLTVHCSPVASLQLWTYHVAPSRQSHYHGVSALAP